MSRPAPAARALLAQATARWPKRNKASDGIVPSAAHTKANPNSDHEVGRSSYNHAVDLGHDPLNGCDCAKISVAIAKAKDSRVKYIIFAGRICSSITEPWVWRKYNGANQHLKHMHVSLLDTKQACLDISPWPGVTKTKPAPAPVSWRTTTYVNMRTLPSLNGRVIRVLKAGTAVKVLTTQGKWTKVRHLLRVGYVYSKYLRKG